MFDGGREVLCAGLLDQLGNVVGVEVLGGEERDEVLVAELVRRAEVLRVPAGEGVVNAGWGAAEYMYFSYHSLW